MKNLFLILLVIGLAPLNCAENSDNVVNAYNELRRCLCNAQNDNETELCWENYENATMIFLNNTTCENQDSPTN